MGIDIFLIITATLLFTIGSIYYIIQKKKYKTKLKALQSKPLRLIQKEVIIKKQLYKHDVLYYGVFFVVIGLYFSGLAASTSQYDSTFICSFDITDRTGNDIGIGEFKIITDGPLSSQNALEFQWIKLRPYPSYYSTNLTSFSINIDDEQGSGTLSKDVMSVDWINANQSNPLVINNFNITEQFKFYYEGQCNFTIVYILYEGTSIYSNRVTSTSLQVQSVRSSDEYRNDQVQAAGFTFGVIVVSLPIMFNTIDDYFTKNKED